MYFFIQFQFNPFFSHRLAHASLNQHAEAVRCYERAVQLEPDNESYQSNLQIAEDKLKQTGGGSGGGGASGTGPLGAGMGMGMPGLDVGAMLNNPGNPFKYWSNLKSK